VRDGGALVVQTSSKAIEWLKITGGDGTYPTGMRGAWGSETQVPGATNFTVGLFQIPVNVYTYKVPMSVSLIEDAANLVGVFTQLVADTLAMDEDAAFLVGDGAGKPRGILPEGANDRGFTEKASGDANTLTVTGLKSLRRGIATQYRVAGRASLIGESAAAEIIEGLKDGNNQFYFDSLDHGVTKVYGATWRESEAMPSVAANAYPLVHANLSGYAIVERLGLAIQRYNDSYTGINVVEFQVRKRLGGDVIEPWKFAVQKVAAS
jgi:HK97 family phage major capsid protein